MSGETEEKSQRSNRIVLRLLVLVFLLVSAALLFRSFYKEGAPLCQVDLPLLSHNDATTLLADATALLQDPERLPFEQLGWSHIEDAEAKVLNEIAPKEDQMGCNAATYGTYPLRLLASAWSGLRRGDVLVDLGAGIGYVLVAAALLTNSSGRGIELSPTRAQRACEALIALSDILAPGTSTSDKIVAPASTGSRHFSIWQADLFQPPPTLWEAPADPSRQLAAFSYANCFGDTFIQMIMKSVAKLPHDNVRLMISKLPKDETQIPSFGLQRVKNSGIHTYAKCSDCKPYPI